MDTGTGAHSQTSRCVEETKAGERGEELRGNAIPFERLESAPRREEASTPVSTFRGAGGEFTYI